MLNVSVATRVYAVCGITDMRKSYNGLYAIVKGHLQSDPLNGHLYVFCNRKRDTIKVLFWDGSGFWTCGKRLEKGTFAWPQSADKSLELSIAQWNLLIGGLDLKETKRRKWLA